MNERLSAAETALKAGRRGDAIEHLVAALEENPAQTLQVYRALLLQLYSTGRNEEGEAWAAKAVVRFSKDTQIWNLRGVMLRRLGRHAEALAALDAGAKLSPNDTAVLNNRGNVLMDLGEAARAEQVFIKMVRLAPRNAEFHRLLGRAQSKQGRRDHAMSRFRQGLMVSKTNVDLWLDIMALLVDQQLFEAADEAAEKALAAVPGDARLLESKIIVLRRSGDIRRAIAYMETLLPEYPQEAWLHYQLGGAISDFDRAKANVHLRLAVSLNPDKIDYRMALIESLERTRTGDEGANIEESYKLVREALKDGSDGFSASHLKIAYEILVRVCAFDDVARVGDLKTLGRIWAEAGKHTALLKLLAQAKSLEDRHELLEQHLIWGRASEANAALNPIKRPAPRAPDGKIRVGLMSSDLRRHPVGYFAMPLFEHFDRERFELYAYSFYQNDKADAMQEQMASQATAFRWRQNISMRNAAQMIADDQLDMLIELGGSTHMNKLEVMAYKAAPLQASWLGYPHSAGLSTIDYLVVDPYIQPTRDDMMIEKPLALKNAWYPITSGSFRDLPAAQVEPPMTANGYVTFGTANNPQKYNPDVFRTWARVMQQCPDSRFLFVRPEGGTASFRKNVVAFFGEQGVAAERILFEAVRGSHLPHYNRMDMSLDAFPQTGGTTTCESLWMGAPCVTLVGDGPFERLSYSVLMNLGLDDLCAFTHDDFVAAAVKLAHDPARIAQLRGSLRERIKASPLGQAQTWARDFYDVVAEAVEANR